MKRLCVLFLTLALSMMPMTSFAETETDSLGNIIDWQEDIGGEDAAGTETEADLIKPPEYDESERAEVDAILETTEADEETEETGFVTFTCDFDNSWAGYNVRVSLYDQNFEQHILYCYSQNNFEVMVELPVGHYQIAKIQVPGDDGRYTLVYDMAEFDITEQKPVTVTIRPAGEVTKPTKPVETENATEIEAEN